MVSTKELFQIRLTLISNGSDCENMIALFVFSFIPLFLLIPHKRDLTLKACISKIFLFFSISHFSSKKSLSSFPENTLKNISTQNSLRMNALKLLILLAWFVSIESWSCFVFPISGTGLIRLIFNCYYHFLGISVLTQGLLMVLSSITMISGLFIKRGVFILCISTSTVFYKK